MERTLIIITQTLNNNIYTAGLLDILTETYRLAELNPEMDIVIYHNSESKEVFLNDFTTALDSANLEINRSFKKYLNKRLKYKKQIIGTEQEIYYNAFSAELADENTEKVVLINCTCPMLLGEAIDDAFYYIDHFHLTLGGTKAGSIYLMASDELYPELFRSFDWTDENVFKKLNTVAKEHSLAVRNLDMLMMINNKEDMKRIYPKLCENRTADNTQKIIKEILKDD